VCGIIGYSGPAEAAPIVVKGLKRLEYRGYDSFGVATLGNGIEVCKKQGRISGYETRARELHGTTGIGHTRWATHGVPNDANAHPHLDCRNRIAVVHNGIIENYVDLKRELEKKGHIFRSETDTEVIVHIIEDNYEGNLEEAVKLSLPLLSGSYALLVIAEGEERIVAARCSSPLVIGIGDNELFAASDMTPILDYTSKAVYLEDGDLAVLSQGRLEVQNAGVQVQRKEELIEWSLEDVKKGGFPHYMQKEIFEQPEVFSRTIRALRREELPEWLQNMHSVTIVACGTSYHAGLVFRYSAEEILQVPARLEFASEFKYFTPPVHNPVIGITQSGETADTIAALKKARERNCPTLAVTNVVGSSVTRVADHTLYMRAGPEISVAATKSFITELAVLLHIIDRASGNTLEKSLDSMHLGMEEALLLDLSPAVDICRHAEHIFFVGRGPFYPVALEGALKMKEISYIHAEGYAAGEIKHGPFALLSHDTPVVAVCTPGKAYHVMISNIKEMKARGTPLIILGQKGDLDLAGIADVFIPLPEGDIFTHIFAATVALQMLAYYTAAELGMDIDKPRNLAKSVTVE
jgi:glucosamine--fructose-6-phosphate aminotransferase (isomerizing)